MANKLRILKPRLTTVDTRTVKNTQGSWAGAKRSSKFYDRKWRKAREAYLAKNPLCVHCLDEKLVTAATEVDHKIPHEGDMDLFWDEQNWQSLCKPHHSKKTATENGGFGNFAVKRGHDD